MLKTLMPVALGIADLPLPEAIVLARDTGFAAVTVDIRVSAKLAAERGLSSVIQLFQEAAIAPAHWSIPVAYRHDERYADDLRTLPALAALGHDLGCPRATTGVVPGSDERPFAENLTWHVERLRPIAELLAEAGCRLGIEFIGPKTFRQPYRYEFIYSLEEAMRLAAAIGTGNVGILLDAWHLYTSHGSNDEILDLNANDVVVVHVNDAPAGIPPDDQIDSARALPLATGVIDLVGFMAALKQIGFTGPVMAEPFSQQLNDLAKDDPEAAATETARSMTALWRAAGLS